MWGCSAAQKLPVEAGWLTATFDKPPPATIPLMLKALLISLATLVSFDAVAWQSAMRQELVRAANVAWSQAASQDWSWG